MKTKLNFNFEKDYDCWLLLPTIAVLWSSNRRALAIGWLSFGLDFGVDLL